VPVLTWTPSEIEDFMRANAFDSGAIESVRGWLARGDGAAVYRCTALDSAQRGRIKITSFGSAAAQLPDAEPPTRLPDIGDQIHWSFTLEAIARPA
jgi:hypothetical protein